MSIRWNKWNSNRKCFKIDKSRLPEGYQGEDIAFVCMGEQQKITAGQDWTTEISGQIFLLDLGSQDGVLDNIPSFEATTVEVEATGGAPTAGIQNEQARVVPELLELKRVELGNISIKRLIFKPIEGDIT